MRCIDFPRRARPALAALIPLLLAGCALGPDYVRPDVAPDAVNATQLHRAANAGVVDVPPPSQWWRELDDPQLTWLIDTALAQSPDLRAAEAKVRAARGLSAQRRAERLPQVGALGAYARVEAPDSVKDGIRDAGEGIAQATDPATGTAIRQATQDLDMDSNLYVAGFDASWELDFFGRRRRALEGAAAQAESAQAQLADAQVRLAAEIGQVYANYRGLQARIVIAGHSLQAAQQILDLTTQRRSRGAASDLQVERVRGQLQQQQALLLPLEARRDEALDQLALMIGQAPGALDARLASVAPLPSLPAEVKVDDPASVIRRRPDVRQAERELAGANAQIGEALSAYFPQVTLYGSLASVATSPGDLGAGSAATVLAPVLRWSILDFGRIRAQVAQARAGTEGRAASYEQTVLAALQDANTALSNFGSARRQVLVATQAQASADRAATLMQQRRDAGASSLIDLLDVQRQQLTAQDSAAQAQLQLVVDYVALQKSLGLGWQDAPPPGAVSAQRDSARR
ncbi:efflux transporter outer membrane subunit [Pseudoxanthomonas sp.]|uniref:efflux transporter outer membrane subunit n=1 Tax=Pseudoxanthomonas sp. TaxID=1871049 RepID=UPI002627AA9A|nr:efflux transporter outer membrane subunit [Pseudoxanthomonas sp.]WDS37156.1 MAG: efflux transporter outer membrane subunit [Pseudoxanthomonas sp.]